MSTKKDFVRWEVCSKLEFNVGPTKAQTIYSRAGAVGSIALYG
jgi:hypothetical protein